MFIFIQQKSPTSTDGVMNAILFSRSIAIETLAEKGGMKFNSSLIKPPADVTDF